MNKLIKNTSEMSKREERVKEREERDNDVRRVGRSEMISAPEEEQSEFKKKGNRNPSAKDMKSKRE